MKKKTVMVMLAAVVAGGITSGFAAGVYAAGEPDALGVHAAEEEESDRGEDEEAPEGQGNLYGLWETEDYIELVLLPDGSAYDISWSEEVPMGRYSLEEDRVLFDMETVPEEYLEGAEDPSLTMKLKEISEGDLAEYSDVFVEDRYAVEAGKDFLLEVTAGMTDQSDPLNPETVSETSYACKKKNQGEYLFLLLKDKTWELEGKLLKLEANEQDPYSLRLDADFDNGAQTGRLNCYQGEELTFNWDGGAQAAYTYVTADEDSVTLANKENSGQIIVLKNTGSTEESAG